MIFEKTAIEGVYLIKLEPHTDERGFFARSFSAKDFAKAGLITSFPECNYSYNKLKGTLRGMHYQAAPYEEVKVVTCVQGAIYDVALDIRKDSATYGKWLGFELTADNHHMLYIDKGIAHGFQTLADDTMIYYQMGAVYNAASARTIPYNDARFGIKWRLPITNISLKDKG